MAHLSQRQRTCATCARQRALGIVLKSNLDVYSSIESPFILLKFGRALAVSIVGPHGNA